MELDIQPQSKSSFSIKSPLSFFTTFKGKRQSHVPQPAQSQSPVKRPSLFDNLNNERRLSNLKNDHLPLVPLIAENLKRGSLEMMFDPALAGGSPHSPQKGILMNKKEAISMPLIKNTPNNKETKEKKGPVSLADFRASQLGEQLKNAIPQVKRAKRVTFAIENKNSEEQHEDLDFSNAFRRRQHALKFSNANENELVLIPRQQGDFEPARRNDIPLFPTGFGFHSPQGTPRREIKFNDYGDFTSRQKNAISTERSSSQLPPLMASPRINRDSLMMSPMNGLLCPIKTNLWFEKKPVVANMDVEVKKNDKTEDNEEDFSFEVESSNVALSGKNQSGCESERGASKIEPKKYIRKVFVAPTKRH